MFKIYLNKVGYKNKLAKDIKSWNTNKVQSKTLLAGGLKNQIGFPTKGQSVDL